MPSFCSRVAAFAWQALHFGTPQYAVAGFVPSSAVCGYVVASSRDHLIADNMVLSMPVILICTSFGPYSIPMLVGGFVGYIHTQRK